MWCEGRDQRHERLDFGAVGMTASLTDRIEVLHHRGTRRVVAQAADVIRHLPNRRVQLLLERATHRLAAQLLDRYERVPQPAEETERPLQSLIAEIAAFLIWAQEHQVGAKRVRAPL